MKKLALILITILVLTNCKKVKDELVSTEMSAKIDGVAWTSLVRNTTMKNDRFYITGTDLNGKTISIQVNGIAVGDYTTNLVDYIAAYKETLSTATEDAFSAITGKVSITNVNSTKKEISGTFSFEMFKITELSTINLSITEGVFNNLSYIEVSE